MEQRNIGLMILLTVITLGVYAIYWIIVTKLDLNDRGAHIPTAWLFIVPFANIYFLYQFAQAFAEHILNNKQLTIAYFILLFLLFPIGTLICQSNINDFIERHPSSFHQNY